MLARRSDGTGYFPSPAVRRQLTNILQVLVDFFSPRFSNDGLWAEKPKTYETSEIGSYEEEGIWSQCGAEVAEIWQGSRRHIRAFGNDLIDGCGKGIQGVVEGKGSFRLPG
jgi:hypothetical protein